MLPQYRPLLTGDVQNVTGVIAIEHVCGLEPMLLWLWTCGCGRLNHHGSMAIYGDPDPYHRCSQTKLLVQPLGLWVHSFPSIGSPPKRSPRRGTADLWLARATVLAANEKTCAEAAAEPGTWRKSAHGLGLTRT